MTERLALYSAVDDVLTHYDVDPLDGRLTRRRSLTMPAKVQYAWRHPNLRVLYVSTSNGGPRVAADCNHISAYSIGGDGALRQLGEPRPLSRRAVHMCVDPSGRFALNGHNFPASGITVHALKPDGSVGAEVVQPNTLDYGIYPHQVMVLPSGKAALMVDRGNKAQGDKPEDPGALRTFGFEDGILSKGQVVAPAGGFGFGPRHVSFHPSGRFLYASDERTNRLYMFRMDGDQLEVAPAFTRSTLADPENVKPRQIAGPIHVHPAGHSVYVANRADHNVERDGRPVFTGGENNLAVYRIDPHSGEPTVVQHADTHSYHVRTFACDPGGRLLVTASIKQLTRQEGERLVDVPAALSVFRIGANGCLEYLHKVDVETSARQLHYWMGMVALD